MTAKSCQLLHNHVTISCTTKPQLVEVMELEQKNSHDASIAADAINKLDRQRVLSTTKSSPEFWTKFQREVPAFSEEHESPYNIVSNGLPKKIGSIRPFVSI